MNILDTIHEEEDAPERRRIHEEHADLAAKEVVVARELGEGSHVAPDAPGAEGDEESETDASVSDRLVASASEPLCVIAP